MFLGLFDSSPDVLETKELLSFTADMLDGLYRPRLNDKLAEFCARGDLSPQELLTYLCDQGRPISEPTKKSVSVGAISPVMGHSWVAFFAHSCLAECVHGVEGREVGELARGRAGLLVV